MKERLSQSEAQQNPNVETSQATVDKTSPESDKQVNEVAPKSNVTRNPYANVYTRDYTIVREAKRERPPEPKWGNFDPLYRGK